GRPPHPHLRRSRGRGALARGERPRWGRRDHAGRRQRERGARRARRPPAGAGLIEGLVVREGERLARHTAWRTGGPCDAFLLVNRREALPAALELCRARGWSRTVLGAGTRTVVRDGGV